MMTMTITIVEKTEEDDNTKIRLLLSTSNYDHRTAMQFLSDEIARVRKELPSRPYHTFSGNIVLSVLPVSNYSCESD